MQHLKVTPSRCQDRHTKFKFYIFHIKSPDCEAKHDTLSSEYRVKCYHHYWQGRIIHEAGEAKASEPRAPIGAQTAQYNENLQSRATLGPEITREKICGLLKFLPSGIPIRPGVLPQFTPRLFSNVVVCSKL